MLCYKCWTRLNIKYFIVFSKVIVEMRGKKLIVIFRFFRGFFHWQHDIGTEVLVGLADCKTKIPPIKSSPLIQCIYFLFSHSLFLATAILYSVMLRTESMTFVCSYFVTLIMPICNDGESLSFCFYLLNLPKSSYLS